MMTYGCESWVLREKKEVKLQATEMNVLRKVAGVTRLDCIRNDEIRQRLYSRDQLCRGCEGEKIKLESESN